MQVTIGGIEVDLSSCGVRTLGELINAVQDAAAEKNQVITGTLVNGEQLSPEQEAAQQARELGPDDVIDFTVQNASDLLTGVLEQARSTLPDLKDKLEQVAAALQSGSRQEAFSLFSDCLTHWRQVIQLLQVAQACLGYDPNQIEIEGCSPQTINEKLLATLQETKRAMERGDLVSLSDLLEYELINRVRQEETIFEHLIGMVA